MPAVATLADVVTCGHSGKVVVVGTPKLTVGGNPVLLAAGVAGGVVTGCITPIVTTTPPSKPCSKVLLVTSPPSLSTKLKVGAAPVVLSTLKGTTDGVVGGTPQVLLSVTVAQTLLNTV